MFYGTLAGELYCAEVFIVHTLHNTGIVGMLSCLQFFNLRKWNIRSNIYLLFDGVLAIVYKMS